MATVISAFLPSNLPIISSSMTQLAATAAEVDTRSMLLIVVGAHLRAELNDRPLGDRLRDAVLRRQDELRSQQHDDGPPLHAVVCTDLWYLNSKELLARPAIAIGDPTVNAATAYLSNRLPTAFVIENSLRIHLDLEYIDGQVCLWGVDPSATMSAIDMFVERYLDDFLKQAMSSVSP